MSTEVNTRYKQQFINWLNSETEMQKLGLSDVFNWQWFITMTSKDTMTKNGARLAMTRFLAMYLQESKTEEVQCFWVAEPHNQGKDGYHIHALLQTQWPTPPEKGRQKNLALMLDDIYQRAMGVVPIGINYEGKMQYTDKWHRPTTKHRFRAESYARARGEYCAKYILKDTALWEFARVTQSRRASDSVDVLDQFDPENPQRDCKGNWDKKAARLRTRELSRALALKKGEDIVSLKKLVGRSETNFAIFSKLRATKHELDITMHFRPSNGVKVYV